MSTVETRFVVCPECDGYGAYVVGDGHWPDGSERNDEVPCPVCDGTGRSEQPVEPMTLEDALALDAEKLDALTRGRKW